MDHGPIAIGLSSCEHKQESEQICGDKLACIELSIAHITDV
jgi:hypothetical protein